MQNNAGKLRSLEKNARMLRSFEKNGAKMLAKSRKLRKKGCTLYCTWCNTICPQKMGLHSGCKNLKFLLQTEMSNAK